MDEKKVGLNAAISVLDCFSLQQPELQLTEISRKMGYPKASVSRYLKSLESAELVKRDRITKKYSLGHKIYKLFYIASNTTSLHKAALTHMQEFRNKYNEIIVLSVVDGNHGVNIERLANSYDESWSPTGILRPLHAGASNKVLLAYMPEKRIQEIIDVGLTKITERTLSEPEALWKELKEIKKKGYSISIGEKTLGIKSIAVPIWKNGSVVGSLATNAPELRLSGEKEYFYIAQLQEAARRISKDLGSLKP